METKYPRVPMFQNLELENFRGFRDEEAIRLAPLTFLVGPNSSGKSSVFDAILLVLQSSLWPFGALAPVWIGDLVDLGSFLDTVYRHDPRRAIKIGFSLPLAVATGLSDEKKHETDWRSQIHLSYVYRLSREKGVQTDYVRRIAYTDDTSGAEVRMTYTVAEKEIPRVHVDGVRVPSFRRRALRAGGLFPVLTAVSQAVRETLSKHPSAFSGKRTGLERALRFMEDAGNRFFVYSFMLGTQRVASGRGVPKRWYLRGRQTIDLMRGMQSRRVFDSVEPAMLEPTQDTFLPSRQRPKPTTKRDLERYLQRLCIADKVEAEIVSDYHSTIAVVDNVSKVRSKLIDVGYGASQVIPVIAACLSPAAGPLFVEQPEIHLHPKAQGDVAELLVETSRRRQVVVETHSEHMINRARIMIANGQIPPEHVIINYVDRDSRGSHIKRIPLNANGDFEAEWPEGFFDERYHDTVQLMRLKNRGGK